MNRGQKILIGFLGLLMLVFGLVVVMRVWVMPPASATVAATKIPKGEYVLPFGAKPTLCSMPAMKKTRK